MITRQFNNSTIEIREDGYFNLTSMFKPFGKYPKDYLKTDSAKAFIAALEADGTNILSGTELVQVIKGGAGEQGTFAHRLIAIDSARFLSPEFHVTIIKWADEIMMGATPSLEYQPYTNEISYVDKLVGIFSRTDKPLKKEVIVINTEAEEGDPPTRRFDMKEVNSNIYYEVKIHPITLSDLKEIFSKRRYPDILAKLHQDYKLFLVSPLGITEEADCFVRAMKNVHFILGEDLAMEAASLMLKETPFGKEQIQRHVLPMYHDILPTNWRQALGAVSESLLPPLSDVYLLEECKESLEVNSESREDLIFNRGLPLGVCKMKRRELTSTPFRAKFVYKGQVYELGLYGDPIQAGSVVKQKMLEIKGYYAFR